jgi:hypothetical protein
MCLYASQNKERLFPYTTLIYWFFITETECVHCAVRTAALNIIQAMGVSCRPLTFRRSLLPPSSVSKRSLTLKMAVTTSSRNLVTIYQSTRRHTKEESNSRSYNNPSVTTSVDTEANARSKHFSSGEYNCTWLALLYLKVFGSAK